MQNGIFRMDYFVNLWHQREQKVTFIAKVDSFAISLDLFW